LQDSKLAGHRPRLLVVGPVGTPGGGETSARILLRSSLPGEFEVRHFDTTRKGSKESIGRFTLGNAYRAMHFIHALQAELRKFRPNVVHLNIAASRVSVIRDSVFAGLVKRAGSRLVLHSHAGHLEPGYRNSGPLWRRVWRGLFTKADAIICLSPYWKAFFDSLGTGIRSEVIPNPVDPEFVRDLSRVTKQPRNGVRVLFVGAICISKGLMELIEALDPLMDSRPDLRARLVGFPQYPGEQERVLERISRMKNADRVAVPGPKFGAELAAEYRNADLLVLPSYAEGVPMVILEAMAAGLPIVTTNVGGIPDVVKHGVNGLLVPPRDVGALRDALARVIDSAPLGQRMGESNLRDVRHYNADAFASACARLYRSVMNGQSSRAAS
jgi:glycosyltransferase involved in cell wall biosynthesis